MKVIVYTLAAGLLVTILTLAHAGQAPAPAVATAAPAATPAVASAPPATGPSALEVRALEEFNRNQYAVALPMLQKVAEGLKNQPDQLGSIQEDIRVCQKNLNQPANPQSNASTVIAMGYTPSANPAADPNAPVPTGDARKPHPAPKPGETLQMSIKELGNFDYDPEKGGNIPADVKALDGATIQLRGFMIPLDQAESITQFALVPSLTSCCFGQPPQIQHTIIVHVPKGKAVAYYPDEITVEGTLHVQEKKEDGFIVSIFEVNTTSVKPAPK